MKKSFDWVQFPFHTFLIALYPILYLFSQNFVFIPIQEIARSAALTLGLASLLLIGFRLILKEWLKAGALVSLLLMLIFSFGHAANALAQTWTGWFGAAPDLSKLAWIWLAAFGVLSLALLRWRLPKDFTSFLNLVSLTLMVLAGATIVSPLVSLRANSEKDQAQLARLRGQAAAEESATPVSAAQQPDIYYIILDGYERADKLLEYYGYDNSAFIDALKQRDFYVAEQSRSNFLNTTYSLNTSMNLTYISDFPKNTFRKARYSLQTNYVGDFLHRRGYQVVVFDSGTGDTNNQNYDVFVSAAAPAEETEATLNSFEMLLIRTTLGLELFYRDAANNGAVEAVNAELDMRRERITHTLTRLDDFTTQAEPHFLFAHIYSPHIPFLYGLNEARLTYHPDINFYWYQPAPENYVEYYTYQLDYLNRAVLEAVDSILAKSSGPTVIVLQGDHGDDKFLNWKARDARGVDVRSAILNAIYYSDGEYDSLYPTMTPVNTYRLVLNHWFGTQYATLPDRVFAHDHPLETRPNQLPVFEDACAKFGICPPAIPPAPEPH